MGTVTITKKAVGDRKGATHTLHKLGLWVAVYAFCASCQNRVHACTQKGMNIPQITSCSAIQLLSFFKDRILCE